MALQNHKYRQRSPKMNSSRTLMATAMSSSVRMMSTTAKSHVPPLKIHGIPGRYAGSVYTAASKIGALERVENELKAFSAVVHKNANLNSFLNDPTIPRAEKVSKVGGLFDEKTFSHISRNLLITLAANGRISEYNKVISAFDEIMAASRGAVQVTIISAETLKDKQSKQVKEAIAAFVGAGKSVDIKSEVNADILGGLQILIGDKFLDLSVASRVATLSQTLEARA